MEDRVRRRIDDDSLLASVAGVPLTRMARIGLCLVWAGFWAARVLLTDVLALLNPFQAKSVLLELIGQNAFDQGFSICMIWLTVEVAAISWTTLKTGANMLIAKTTPSLRQQVAETLTIEQLEAVLERKREKERRKKEAKANGNKG